MFDVGFSELLVIGVVALLVIGPERMPGVARTIGALLGRLQRYVSEVKSEINREMRLDELKNMKASVMEQAESLENSLTRELKALENTVHESVDQVAAEVTKGESTAESATQDAAAHTEQSILPPTAAVESVPATEPPKKPQSNWH